MSAEREDEGESGGIRSERSGGAAIGGRRAASTAAGNGSGDRWAARSAGDAREGGGGAGSEDARDEGGVRSREARSDGEARRSASAIGGSPGISARIGGAESRDGRGRSEAEASGREEGEATEGACGRGEPNAEPVEPVRVAEQRGERVREGGNGLRLRAIESEGAARADRESGGRAGASGPSPEQEGAGNDGEGGERVPRTAQKAADHRERSQSDRESDRRAGHQEERDAGLDVREGQPRLRLDFQHAAARRLCATRSSCGRHGAGRTGGPRSVRRQGEGVAVGAERRAAIAAGAVVGAGAAAVQTGADVHSGRSGRGAGSEPHAEHREDAEEALRTEPVYRGELEGGHVHQRERDLPNQIRGWSEHGDEDGGADSG